MHCKEKFAQMSGMDPDHVKPSYLDHHSHHTSGQVHELDGKVERAVEKVYGRKV